MTNRKLTRRDLLKAASGAAATAGIARELALPITAEAGSAPGMLLSPQLASPEANLPWYRTHWFGIEVGPTAANDKDGIYYSRINAKEIVQNLRNAKVEYAVIFMKDGDFAYYNSRVVRKCPNLGERDLLREVLDEIKPYKIPIVAYCEIQYDTTAWAAHPEWRMKDSTGKDIPRRVCYRSGYLDHIRQITAELLEYPISGLLYDMLDFGFRPPYGCWCEHCQAAFQKEYGVPMPSGVNWDDAWDKMLQFRSDSNSGFSKALDAFIRSKRPDVYIYYNYHGYPPFSWEAGQQPVKNAINGDFVPIEGLPWAFGHNSPSLSSLFLQSARLGGSYQLVGSRSVFTYFDPTVRPVAEMKWEVATYLAHGAISTIVDKVDYDGTLNPWAYSRIGEVYGDLQAKREYFAHKPLQEVGLYYSCRSRDWYGREDSIKYQAAFYGAHKALMQSHITMGVILDETVSAERLAQFPVVYLPNTAIVSEREVGLLSEYVSSGGNLVVTGLTGLFDQRGNLQEKSALSEILGVRLVRAELEFLDNYLRLPASLAQGEGKTLLDDIPAGMPVFAWGPMAAFEPTSAQAFGELMLSHRVPGAPKVGPMSPNKVVGPAVFVNQFEKGKTIFLPCALDAAYMSNYRIPEHRILLRNVVRLLHPLPEVRVTAPLNVETVVTQDEALHRLLVHLICFSAPATSAAARLGKGQMVLPPIMEEPMEYKARIEINRPFARASAIGKGTQVTRNGKDVRLATSEIHEVVVIS